jgi:predicted DNA-binding protein (UPF0278 family)
MKGKNILTRLIHKYYQSIKQTIDLSTKGHKRTIWQSETQSLKPHGIQTEHTAGIPTGLRVKYSNLI